MVNGDGDWAGLCQSLDWEDYSLYRGREDHTRTGRRVGLERVHYPAAGVAVEILRDRALGCQQRAGRNLITSVKSVLDLVPWREGGLRCMHVHLSVLGGRKKMIDTPLTSPTRGAPGLLLPSSTG